MTTGVLLMAYGSPGSLDEVEAYLRDIRGGREPRPEAVAALRDRYARIGGSSPLVEITRRQAAAVAAALERAAPGSYAVGIGMKHWHPYISEGVRDLIGSGVDEIVGVALAPHYSSISIGGYEQRLREAAGGVAVRMVRSWFDEPAFVDVAADRLRDALDGRDARVIFTAHSLPARILDEGDPYRDQLVESSRVVAAAAGAADWEFAFQSASATGEPWLGPDVGERIDAAAATGVRRVVVAPIGFVSDHLEILFDVDVECAGRAARHGIQLTRTRSLNDDPRLADAIAAAVLKADQPAGARP